MIKRAWTLVITATAVTYYICAAAVQEFRINLKDRCWWISGDSNE